VKPLTVRPRSLTTRAARRILPAAASDRAAAMPKTAASALPPWAATLRKTREKMRTNPAVAAFQPSVRNVIPGKTPRF
jgi:hypothetical protein